MRLSLEGFVLLILRRKSHKFHTTEPSKCAVNYINAAVLTLDLSVEDCIVYSLASAKTDLDIAIPKENHRQILHPIPAKIRLIAQINSHTLIKR